jgi:hypothetical protein
MIGQKKRNIALNVIGIVLIIFSLIRFYFLYTEGISFHIFWLCNHIPLIMGLAILFRNSFVLTAEFSLGFAGMSIWVLDFFYYQFSGFSFTGNGEFFSVGFYIITAFVLHVLTLPLAFWAILLINKQEKKAFIGSMAHFIILIPIIAYFGAERNLNCFFKSCLNFMPTFKLYPLFLLIAYSLIFILPINYLINKILDTENFHYNPRLF